MRKKEINKEKGIVTRSRSGKCEGRKRILEIHPELEYLIVKLRRKDFSWVRISKTLMDEYEYKVSPISVGRILKDVQWMRKVGISPNSSITKLSVVLISLSVWFFH